MLLNEKRTNRKMQKYGLDALIATSPANVLYTGNFSPYGRVFVFFPYEKNLEPAIVAPLSGSTPIVLSSDVWIKDVRYYGEFYIESSYSVESLTNAEQKYAKAAEFWGKYRAEDPVKILINLLEERDLTKGKIGVDESYLQPEHPFWGKIKSQLPELEVIRAQHIFREIRMVKSEEEIRRIQEALRITEKAWDIALQHVKEGMTEKEFAKIYESTIIAEGGRISSRQGYYGSPIAFGHRTSFVDIADPSDDKLKKGDLIRLDGGACYMGYPSDIGRTAVLGPPDDKLEKYYNAITEGEQLAIDLAKPGAKASEIFNAVVKKVREAGIPHFKRHHVGHGWGIEGYDPPLISSNDHTILEEGMVLWYREINHVS
jgi:Xaa-Pro aminopeptidase